MPPLALWQALRQRPFASFLLQMLDGREYEIRHPDLVLVAAGYAVIGVPATPPQPGMIERHEIVAMDHIIRLVPLGVPASGGNGEPQGQ